MFSSGPPEGYINPATLKLLSARQMSLRLLWRHFSLRLSLPSGLVHPPTSQRDGCELALPVCRSRKSPVCWQFVFVAILTAKRSSCRQCTSTDTSSEAEHINIIKIIAILGSDGRTALQQTVQRDELITQGTAGLLLARPWTFAFHKLRTIYMVSDLTSEEMWAHSSVTIVTLGRSPITDRPTWYLNVYRREFIWR
jgi:hypothetical protein